MRVWPDPAPTPLPSREFNRHLDSLLSTGKLNPDILPYMDAWQQRCINEVKKSLKRLSDPSTS